LVLPERAKVVALMQTPPGRPAHRAAGPAGRRYRPV